MVGWGGGVQWTMCFLPSSVSNNPQTLDTTPVDIDSHTLTAIFTFPLPEHGCPRGNRTGVQNYCRKYPLRPRGDMMPCVTATSGTLNSASSNLLAWIFRSAKQFFDVVHAALSIFCRIGLFNGFDHPEMFSMMLASYPAVPSLTDDISSQQWVLRKV